MPTTVCKTFTVKQTNIAKGIACILLLFHHLFYAESSYERFTSLCFYNGIPMESVIALMCKVCVTVFLFLSGYGVNETINKRVSVGPPCMPKTVIGISCRLLWKLWIGYVVVFLLFVPWQGLFDRKPYTSVIDLIWDVMGIAHITGTPTMNLTWWFMSVAMISYILTPLFKIIVTKQKTLLLAVVPLSFLLYLFLGGVFGCYAFLFGMVFSEFGILNSLQRKFASASRIYTWSVCIVLVMTAGVLRYVAPSWGDFPLAAAIVIFSFLCVSEVKLFAVPLEFIGKHSANIFFFHSFIYAYNFTELVYAPKYAPLILIAFVMECLLISMLIEFIKKVTGIKKRSQHIEKVIGGDLRQ